MKDLNWKNILYCHTFFKHDLNSFSILAEELEYSFFCWNDRIYKTGTRSFVGKIEDLKERFNDS